jgi:hypothetical protein
MNFRIFHDALCSDFILRYFVNNPVYYFMFKHDAGLCQLSPQPYQPTFS